MAITVLPRIANVGTQGRRYGRLQNHLRGLVLQHYPFVSNREHGAKTSYNTMKNIIVILSLGASLLGGCAVYLPDDGPVARPQGGPGNGFCPPGQAKKGNC